MNLKSIFFLSVFVLNTFSAKAISNQEMVFNLPVKTPQSQYVIELMALAYQDLGYKLVLKEHSYETALKAANQGFFDGQLGRITDITQQYPNLIKVPFVLFDFKLLLIHEKKYCYPCDISNFSSISYRSGYPVAHKFLNSEQYLGERIPVQNIKTQLALLAQNKVDAVLLLDFQLSHDLPHFESANYQIQEVAQLNSYHFLHEKHTALISPLLKQLNSLKQSGVVHKIKDKHGVKSYVFLKIKTILLNGLFFHCFLMCCELLLVTLLSLLA